MVLEAEKFDDLPPAGAGELRKPLMSVLESEGPRSRNSDSNANLFWKHSQGHTQK